MKKFTFMRRLLALKRELSLKRKAEHAGHALHIALREQEEALEGESEEVFFPSRKTPEGAGDARKIEEAMRDLKDEFRDALYGSEGDVRRFLKGAELANALSDSPLEHMGFMSEIFVTAGDAERYLLKTAEDQKEIIDSLHRTMQEIADLAMKAMKDPGAPDNREQDAKESNVGRNSSPPSAGKMSEASRKARKAARRLVKSRKLCLSALATVQACRRQAGEAAKRTRRMLDEPSVGT